jgi:hypothetical protein
MNDDELFEYLDAKAAYMKLYAKRLSSFKAKNYAANSAAVQFQNEGTSKLDANFPSLSKINEQATKDYQETISKKSDKMAKGGGTNKKIVVELYGGKKEYYDNEEILEMIDRYEDFVGADNLPKWMYMSAMKSGNFEGINPKFKKTKLKESSINVLKKILDADGDVYINVRSDKPETNKIIYNYKMAMGGVIKKGVRVRLKDKKLGEKRYNQGYTGEATILTNEPNQYGMYQIDVDVEDGFPRYRDDAYAHKDEIEVLYKWYLLYDGKILRGFNSQSEAKKNMDALVKQNKDSGYSIKKMVDDVNIRLGQKMAMGGKVKFQDKVKAIKASLLKTKKVPKKVQKDYGKTYNAKEAELAAKRIAGAMAKKGIK